MGRDVGGEFEGRRERVRDRAVQRDLVRDLGTQAVSFDTSLIDCGHRCFIGYSNANYALAEVRDPVRTIKRAAPLAMVSVTLVYMLVNVAYYAVVDKEEIVGSGRIAAALYFGKLWGVGAERVRYVS